MNKQFFAGVLILALLLLLFVSCGPSGRQSGFGSEVDSTAPASHSGMHRANAEGKAKNGRIDEYYTDDAPRSVSKEAVSKYIDEERTTDSLAALYADSDEVASVPILGMYLEKTSLFVCLFKKQGALIGTHALAVDHDGNVTGELCELLGETAGTLLADTSCFSKISACLSAYPDFEIEGVVYQDYGYSTVYPIGKNKGDETIRYFENELTEFQLVDSFTSIEAGRKAFNAYWEFRANVLSSLRIYEWTNYDRYPYINKYRYQDVHSSGARVETYQYLYDSDWYLLIPLLNANGKEGDCALYLLYQKDKLIAETILQSDSDGTLRAIKERVSDKDSETGKYIGLDGIDYVAACNRLTEEEAADIKGIGFNGQQYFVVPR